MVHCTKAKVTPEQPTNAPKATCRVGQCYRLGSKEPFPRRWHSACKQSMHGPKQVLEAGGIQRRVSPTEPDKGVLTRRGPFLSRNGPCVVRTPFLFSAT
ncbi:hypothetical protein VARIO8X_60113 [Burkholderiales bacterium 8X]|nr:hypothetical protein VARIO8X_60113 [Burkholderiales bacterium 8X]